MRLVAAEAQGSTTPVYGVTFGDVDDTGWALPSQIHALADGAEWIEKKGREIFGDQLLFTVDFFHLSDYLAAASEKCRPKHPKRWLARQQNRLKRAGTAWLKQNAHDLAQLRGIRSNNRWDEYWLAQKAA